MSKLEKMISFMKNKIAKENPLDPLSDMQLKNQWYEDVSEHTVIFLRKSLEIPNAHVRKHANFKNLIKELIDKEDHDQPLADRAIAEKLGISKGQVHYFRKLDKLKPSHLRKQDYRKGKK